MGRRLRRVGAVAGDAVVGVAVAFVAFGLVPMLWMGDGWAGAIHRVTAVWPLVVVFAVPIPNVRELRERRARRRAEEQAEKVTATSETASG